MNRYPEWRRKRCPHCAADMGMSAQVGVHWTGSANPPVCQAMFPDEYITSLEAQLAAAERQLEAARKALESADGYILSLRREIYAPVEKHPTQDALNDLASAYTRDRTAIGDGALVGTVRALTLVPPEPPVNDPELHELYDVWKKEDGRE